MSLFRRKDVMALQSELAADHSLKRALGAGNLVMLGIGAIIGAGIFVLTGQAAATYAGPAIVYSFLLAGLACAFAGLCYAEFAAMIPIGSAYTYGYATLGEFFAWIIGWDLILEYLFAASTVAVGWSGYAVSLLRDMGIDLPVAYASAPYTHTAPPDAGFNIWRLFTEGWSRNPGAVLNVPAMVIVGLITVLLVIGIKESSRFNNIIVVIKVTVVLAFIAFGMSYINRENWEPFVPTQTGPGEYGWSGILRAAGVIFFAYIGFDAVSTAAQEAKNPQRDMPIGILLSLAICTVRTSRFRNYAAS
jgi:APA family basic amino acid/polyamine antiporter